MHYRHATKLASTVHSARFDLNDLINDQHNIKLSPTRTLWIIVFVKVPHHLQDQYLCLIEFEFHNSQCKFCTSKCDYGKGETQDG